jgi:hypothetical protein
MAAASIHRIGRTVSISGIDGHLVFREANVKSASLAPGPLHIAASAGSVTSFPRQACGGYARLNAGR